MFFDSHMTQIEGAENSFDQLEKIRISVSFAVFCHLVVSDMTKLSWDLSVFKNLKSNIENIFLKIERGHENTSQTRTPCLLHGWDVWWNMKVFSRLILILSGVACGVSRIQNFNMIGQKTSLCKASKETWLKNRRTIKDIHIIFGWKAVHLVSSG